MKIKIHYSLLVLFFLAFFAGFVQKLSILLFLIILHETGHIFACRLFKREVNAFTLLPLGAVIDFNYDENAPLREEFLIYSAGLIVNLAVLIFSQIINLPKDVIDFNNYILVFNILPIWPLDGGRILEVALSRVMPFKKTIKFIPFFSLTLIVLLFILGIFFGAGWNFSIMLSYLFMQNITSARNKEKRFKHFLLKKYLYPNSKLAEREVKIKSKNLVNNFFKGVNNILRYEEKTKDEKKILAKMFENS